jgi:hypothetical protein
MMYILTCLFATHPDVCAEYMLYALFAGEKGAFRRGDKGDDIGKENYFGSEEARKKLWEHTAQVAQVDK